MTPMIRITIGERPGLRYDKEIRNRVKDDPHSLGKWRVDGALPHIDAWYAFHAHGSLFATTLLTHRYQALGTLLLTLFLFILFS